MSRIKVKNTPESAKLIFLKSFENVENMVY